VKFGQMVAEKLLESGIDGSAQKADIGLKDGPGSINDPATLHAANLSSLGAVRRCD
jgi:hypothetical protein